jgi:hypothetical protein
MAQMQKPDPKKFATIGKLKEIIAKNNSDKKYIEDKRKAYGTDMSNADEDDIKDQVRLSQIEDQNYRYGNLIKKANKEAAFNANSKKAAEFTNKMLNSKKDTTVIAKPYKVTTKEITSFKDGGLGLASPTVADSTRKKVAYNASVVIPSMVKRNAEREKEGKSPISLKSIMGNDVGVFSNKGKSFSSAPLITKKKK